METKDKYDEIFNADPALHAKKPKTKYEGPDNDTRAAIKARAAVANEQAAAAAAADEPAAKAAGMAGSVVPFSIHIVVRCWP